MISLGGLSGPALVLVMALVIEAALGRAGHSSQVVAWVERVTATLQRRAPHAPAAQLVWGALLAVLVPVLFAAPALLLGWLAIPDPLVLLLSVVLLRACLSLARPGPVATLARDLARDFVAPLLGYALLGVPGAIYCRAAGAVCAHLAADGERPSMARTAARLDAMVSWLPSWLTAALLVTAGLGRGLDARLGLRGLRQARSSVPAPARALAGLLRVDLANAADDPGPVAPATLDEAWRTARLAAWVGAGLALVWLAGRHGFLL
jgi:adenosylcobinamide-phosphate synthase